MASNGARIIDGGRPRILVEPRNRLDVSHTRLVRHPAVLCSSNHSPGIIQSNCPFQPQCTEVGHRPIAPESVMSVGDQVTISIESRPPRPQDLTSIVDLVCNAPIPGTCAEIGNRVARNCGSSWRGRVVF